MKQMLRLTIIFAFLLASFTSFSQYFMGYGNSNYAGISGRSLNPAYVVDSRYKVDIELVGVHAEVYNNFCGLKRSALEKDANGEYNAFEDSLFQSKYLVTRQNDVLKNKNQAYANVAVNLPSFVVNLDRKSALAFNWRVRNYVNVDGVSDNLATLIYNELEYPSLWVSQLNNKKLSVQTMSWAEYGATYGRVFVDKGEHIFKAAGTVKLLQGLQAAYVFIEDLNYQFHNDSTLSLFSAKVDYGHSTNFEVDGNNIKYKYISNISFGIDLGFVYEWRPKHSDYKYDMDGETNLWRRDQEKYKLRAGLSILDIGSIKFQKGDLSNNFVADVDYWNLNSLDFGDSIPVQNWDDTLQNRFGTSDPAKDFRMNLPTAISTQLDYNIHKDFYINFTSYIAFQFTNNANKVHDLTTFCLAPRWDHKWFGVFVPVSYNMMNNFGVGADVRLGPLIFGTNNMLPLISKKKDIYGADFHLALKIPILHGKPKDKDDDKISDKKDQCIDTKGTWEFVGCPDTDGDHIKDAEDDCPLEPGTPEFKGCPDRDGDKIIDKVDDCPDDAGLAEFNGCPDRDGDKIIDKNDECPDTPGLAAFNGCPDTDGDGLPDFKDECPTEPGPIDFNGCPDRDGDGLRDKDDRCPDKPGPISNRGCPELKLQLLNAQLGILDEVTVVDGKFTFGKPFDKKTAIFKLIGEDADTITQIYVANPDLRGKTAYREGDKLFRFPKEAEVVQLTQAEQEIVKKAFDNLEFATGKAIIKKESYASLDELAELLKKYNGWKLKIEGHTDNQGKPAANMTLSQNRSKAVAKYLTQKGIDAKRFEVKWYGQTKPIAPNTTEEGRQKNRRVEMTIVE